LLRFLLSVRILRDGGGAVGKKLIAVGALFLITAGCNLPDRVGRLEKQISDLRAEVEKDQSVADFDSQAKCARDAKQWYREN
jgi:hypothetical protein